MRIPRRSVRFYWPLLAIPLALALAEREAQAVNIYVTNLQQKIDGKGGCSLQEAIYSANLRTNQAVDHINADGSDNLITTQCVPGTGNDTIVLPVGATFMMTTFVQDAHNYLGPTATPLIFSNITIAANGSLLQWTGTAHVRAFAVGTITVGPGGGIFNSTGSLTIRNAYIKGFVEKGGDGACGGGGGMGAGGAIYVTAGQLTIENTTFESNMAIGGNGGSCAANNNGFGGGGGLSGNGGAPQLGGGGGGGALGNGGAGGFFVRPAVGFPSGSAAGGGGGGTFYDGTQGGSDGLTGPGGIACGGNGGNANQQGSAAPCAGGGGGGGGVAYLAGNDGGDGGYGGGGGGMGLAGIAGGKGGFGGGGG
ncbi:MAG TPA: hypothetical protein VGZ73_26685, partial [Bryobacteraceae bacterium]|nr:hypothetical protein [Bryobacteraceae bacterium]